MPSFPGALATDADLLVAIDNAQTTLAAAVASGDTALSVVSGAAIASNAVITIDSELILLGAVAGVNATSCTRGYGGTAAASHLIGATVNVNVIAAHHNKLKDELIAMQAALGAGLSLAAPGLRTSAYAFPAQTPAQALTAANPAIVTLSTMPRGVNATSPGQHYLRLINSNPALSETVLLTARSATTITFTPANSHISGAWTVQSATAGIQEAINAAEGDTVLIPTGTHLIYQRITIPRTMAIYGSGSDNTFLQLQVATIDCFYYSSRRVTVGHVCFTSSSGWQTAGACVNAVGTSYLHVIDIRSVLIFDLLRCDWTAGFLYVNGIRAEGMVRYLIYHAATSASGIQLNQIYADGRYQSSPELLSPSLFYFKGSIAGLTFTNFWLQAAAIHFTIEATSLVGANEMVFGPGILDQDTPSTGCVRLFNASGTYELSSNSVHFHNIYGNTDAYFVRSENFRAVSVQDCHATIRGTGSMFESTVDGEDFLLTGNDIITTGGGMAAIFKFAGANLKKTKISGNKVKCLAGTVPALVNVTATTTDRGMITDNFMDGVVALVNGTPTAGSLVCRGNFWELYSGAVAVAFNATYPLPAVDELTLVVMTGSGTVTRITGGYSSRIVRIQTQGITNFNTGGANPGNIGRSITTVANQVVTLIYEVTAGIWWPL